MTTTLTQPMAGRIRLAGASRAASACSWSAAAPSIALAIVPAAGKGFATKPATHMYVDVQHDRTRRLREPSP